VGKKKLSKVLLEYVPPSIEYPEISLFGLLSETVKKFPDNTAVVFQGKKITYKELDLLSDRFAGILNKLEVKKGDKVAIFLPNIPQFIISYYGILKVGATVTTMNPLFKERDVQFQLNDSEAETIVVFDSLYAIVKKVKEKTKLRNIIITKTEEYIPTTERILSPFLKNIHSREVKPKAGDYIQDSEDHPKPPQIKINPKKDLAALQYTGGTTGTPKGAMLTHFNLVSNAVAFATWLKGKKGEEVFLTALPLFHIYGTTTSMNTAIHLGGTMVLLPRFEPLEVLRALKNQRVTIFCGVPTMYSMLISHPEASKYDCSSVRFCISGSAPLPPEVQKQFMDMTGGVLVEGYGLTEASPVTHCNPLDRTLKTVKIGSIGLTLPDTQAMIIDCDTGKKLPLGKIGELAVKGPQIMKGYWKHQKETKDVLKRGWLHTGDIAKRDKDGYFYIVDRKKDLLKYKGYSVYPRELEDLLYEHPAVKMCAVIGKPDDLAGEIPKAFVVLKKGMKVTGNELINFVKERVAPYKRIREVEFRKELPTSSVGKVLRRVLRENLS
jgi:long-chain acyl-CoA synthetase